jgi:uncharacterized membrane protein
MTIDGRDLVTSDNARIEPGGTGAPDGPVQVPHFRDFTKLPLLIIAGMFLAAAVVYRTMPDAIPTHWGVSGAADAWSHKSFFSVFFQPILALGLYGLLVWIPQLDPKRANLFKSLTAYNVMLDVMAGFFALVFGITTAAAFNPRIDVGRFIFIGVGLLFMVVGRLMRDVKQNYTFGVRISWTLADEVVWAKTNRLGGSLFVGAGVLTVLSAFAAPPWNVVVLLGTMAVMLPVLYIYSYRLYRSRHPQG